MMKLRNVARKYGPRIGGAVVLAGASLSAHAAFTMPTAVTNAFADFGAAWAAIEGLIWPILTSVVLGFFVIRMFKKGANKVG